MKAEAPEASCRVRSRRETAATPRLRVARRGYILLELVIALSIFAIAVLGLARALSNTLETANILNREYAVRLAMRSFMEETRRKAISDMNTTSKEDRLDLTMTASTRPIEGVTYGGKPLSDLYELKIVGDFTAGGQPQKETMRVWFYQTQAETERRKRM